MSKLFDAVFNNRPQSSLSKLNHQLNATSNNLRNSVSSRSVSGSGVINNLNEDNNLYSRNLSTFKNQSK